MVVLGSQWELLRLYLRQSPWIFLGYWSVFLLFLLASLYIALLGFRYIQLRYHAEKRAIFRETLGDELLRKALHEAIEKQRNDAARNRRN